MAGTVWWKRGVIGPDEGLLLQRGRRRKAPPHLPQCNAGNGKLRLLLA